MTRDPNEINIFCRVPKGELCYLRYTLEAYEGLCTPTTLPGGGGRVRVTAGAGRRAELEAVLDALTEEIPLIVEQRGDGGRTESGSAEE